jgi:hypothetical protein
MDRMQEPPAVVLREIRKMRIPAVLRGCALAHDGDSDVAAWFGAAWLSP